jgi:uncharacterized protein YbaR (Trm112 family)
MLATIEITSDDIMHGKARSCYQCPLAKAFGRVLRLKYMANVGSTVTIEVRGRFRPLKDGVTLFLPDDIRRWIVDFDDRDDCAPFAFRIEIPDRFVRLAA